MKHLKTIKLNTTKVNAKNVFTGYLSSEFPETIGTAKTITFDVLEMDKDFTFKEIFTNPEKQALTPEQITAFCNNYPEDLRQDGYSTFFLFKIGSDFFVARVRVLDGHLEVNVDQFELDYVWLASCRRRIVVPQRSLKTLENETPSNLDSLTLSSAIKICRDNGLVIYKPMVE